MITGVVPSSPRFLPSTFIAHRVQQSHCSSIFHRVLLTHALALSASQFVRKKKSQRAYTSMHSAGLELTKLTYTRLEDNLIRHRGDRLLSPTRYHTTINFANAHMTLPDVCLINATYSNPALVTNCKRCRVLLSWASRGPVIARATYNSGA